jgi:hypothetical protein
MLAQAAMLEDRALARISQPAEDTEPIDKLNTVVV